MDRNTNDTPSPLLVLAPELLLAIGDELSLADSKNLRLTCKSLAETLSTKVLRTLTLSLSRATLERGLSTLEGLASSPAASSYHAARHATRELRIGSLAPTYDPAHQQPVWRYNGQRWVAEAPTWDPAAMAAAQEKMERHLHEALVSLQGVQSVEWTPYAQDTERTHRTVMDALKTLPRLARLRVRLLHLRVPMELAAFPHLREIATEESSALYTTSTSTTDASHSAAAEDDADGDDIHARIASALAANPHITSIDVADAWRYGRTAPSRPPSLYQLFQRYPAEAPPLRLRHLGLSLCLVKFDADALPHMRWLTSLRLTGVLDPYSLTPSSSSSSSFSASDAEADAILIRHRQQHLYRTQHGASLDEIWRALRTADVRLEHIEVDAVPRALLEYLRSYSGLKRLVVTPGAGVEGAELDGAMSDILAGQFFGSGADADADAGEAAGEDGGSGGTSSGALSNHAATLEELHISALHEGAWCFGAHNARAIAHCGQLRRLRMSVVSAQLTCGVGSGAGLGSQAPRAGRNAPSPSSAGEEEDAIHLLLTTAHTRLPLLQSLHIAGTYPAHGGAHGGPIYSAASPSAGARTGNPLRAHRVQAMKRMRASLGAYRGVCGDSDGEGARGMVRVPGEVILGFEANEMRYVPEWVREGDGERVQVRYVESPVAL